MTHEKTRHQKSHATVPSNNGYVEEKTQLEIYLAGETVTKHSLDFDMSPFVRLSLFQVLFFQPTQFMMEPPCLFM